MDILIGWHIDHHQSSEVMKYVSVALSSFSQLWMLNVPIATTLLSQFVEDMEDYCEVNFNFFQKSTFLLISQKGKKCYFHFGFVIVM